MQTRLAFPSGPSLAPSLRGQSCSLSAHALGKARAYARLFTGSQREGDELVETARAHAVIPPSGAAEVPGSFPPLPQAMRMVARVRPAQAASTHASEALKAHTRLPVETREALALRLGLDLGADEISCLLLRTTAKIEALLDQRWGAYMTLLACCIRR